VCLDEIDNSRPYFIGLLGDRYGWIPDEEKVVHTLNKKGVRYDEYKKSITELEILYGAFSKHKSTCFFYFRNNKGEKCNLLQTTSDEDEALSEKLNKLKEKIIAERSDRVRHYHVGNDSSSRTVELHDFAQMVMDDLKRQIVLDYGLKLDKDKIAWQDIEMEQIKYLVKTKSDKFTLSSRKKFVKWLRDLCSENENIKIMIKGESGIGKTYLLAKFVDSFEKTPDVEVISFFGGISGRSTKINDMLKLLLYQLYVRLGKQDEYFNEINDENQFLTLKNKFYENLYYLSQSKKVIVVVDALNQMERDEKLERFLWVNEKLPTNVNMICSTISGGEDIFEEKKGVIKELNLISDGQIKEQIQRAEKFIHKVFPETTKDILINKKDEHGINPCRNPLYLNILISYLDLLDEQDFEKIYKQEGSASGRIIHSYIDEMIEEAPATIDECFYRLVSKASSLLGEEFINSVLAILSVSRNGFSEEDIEKIFNNLGIEFQSVKFSYLRKLFQNYFTQKENLQWDLAHPKLKELSGRVIDEKQIKTIYGAIVKYLEMVDNLI